MGRIAVILKTDGSMETVPLYKKETLEQLQGWVGGYIECVRVRFAGRIRDVWINEEGLLKNLPVNQEATNLYEATLGCSLKNPLVGDVVIILPNKKRRVL